MSDGATVYSMEDARKIGLRIGIEWAACGFDVREFRRGLNVEAEHGSGNPVMNITNDDPFLTGRIAWAHLNEIPDYYTRLSGMKSDAVSGKSRRPHAPRKIWSANFEEGRECRREPYRSVWSPGLAETLARQKHSQESTCSGSIWSRNR